MRRVGFESCRHHLFFGGFFVFLFLVLPFYSSPRCGANDDDQDS